ncbi:MAG: endonuclease/exonuclease/phosphatase family protein [Anaerolineae bacterium]|jgi:endonuclease/exonuclease/phosphatase (EEP) superfamily protein YafD|nr:endonuclease/exonuclease/phosphatase family protein [Anaerolineae bacterium]
MTAVPAPVHPAPPLTLARQVLHSLFIALVDAYAASVLLLLAGNVLIGEQWVVIAFFNTFAHLLWLPALALLPVCLLLRQGRSVLLLLPIVLTFALTYGGQFWPRSPAAPAGSQPLSLLTFNLLADGSPVTARMAIIRAAAADVVALQEYSPTAHAALPAALADLYPYMALHPQPRATAGQAVLSRYPIVADDYWRYDWLHIPLGHQRVVLDVAGTPVTLYNVHPTHPGMTGRGFFDPSDRGREIADLLQRIDQEQGPLLLAGDFNMPDASRDYRQITTRLDDAYRAAGWGMGWSFPQIPLLRLDYVFFNRHFVAQSAQVWPTGGGSDHFPVRVVLALRPSGG